jgi:hypothetical protein
MEIVDIKMVEKPESGFEVPKGFKELDPNESEMNRAMRKLEENQRNDR